MTIRERVTGAAVLILCLLCASGCNSGRGLDLDIDLAWFLPGGQPSTSTTLPHANVGSPFELHFMVIDVNPIPPNCVGPDFEGSISVSEKHTTSLHLTATQISNVEVAISGLPDAAGEFVIEGEVVFGKTDNPHCPGLDKSFQLTVDPPSGELSIETDPQLPDGRVGQMYAATISASGGQTPYTWSATAGDLPGGHGQPGTPCEGLSADLSVASPPVSGTPVNAGDCVFTLQVEDAAQVTASREFTLHVQSGLAEIRHRWSVFPSALAAWKATPVPAPPARTLIL